MAEARKQAAQAALAMNGGQRVRTKPWPGRRLFDEEEKAAVVALFDAAIQSGNAFGYDGPTEDAYCKEFAESLGGGYADAVNSGTTALYVALRSLNLEPFTEVIVSCITDPGGMMPIPLLNLIPVVADSAPGAYNVGPEQIEPLISPLTSAIVVAHIAGEPCDMEGIMALANKHGIPVVEDCAQAHGAKLNGKPLGTFGAVAAFSTMFGKHHATGGQGGVVFTQDEARYWRIRQASDRGKPHGLPRGSGNTIASLNFNLSDLGAAIGRVQLKKLPSIVARRRAVVAELTERFKELKAIRVPAQLPGAESSYWFWRLEANLDALTCDKDTFCRAVIAEGIPINPRYDAMPHRKEWFVNKSVFGTSRYPWASPAYKGDPNREFPTPNALKTLDTQFNLMIHEAVGPSEIDDIVAAFKKVEAAFLRD